MVVLERRIGSVVLEMLDTFRVVHLGGARQTGKSTLIRDLLPAPEGSSVTLDDEALLLRAREDAAGFVASLERPARIDEFQRAGEGLLLAVKAAADVDRRRGQFRLTGSAGSISVGRSVETLAGRVGRSVLWPLSQGEQRGEREGFLDRLAMPESWPPPSRWTSPVRNDVLAAVVLGGYPEVVTESLSSRSRSRWFESYASEIIDREAVRSLVERTPGPELRRFLRMLAARSGRELVITEVARDVGISRITATRYLALLEALYLVHLQPAWATNATTRAKRASKIHLVDTGLATSLLGLGERELGTLERDRELGFLLESFVVTELCKQASWNHRAVDILHFHDRNGPEVDIIVEQRTTGAVAGVEVKATMTPRAEHARHLVLLRDRLGDAFTVGVVMHLGAAVLPLGDRLWAVPVPALWTPW
jgi:predicted AAA+ superfamily ATPase